jgi:hypothetical protein
MPDMTYYDINPVFVCLFAKFVQRKVNSISKYKSNMIEAFSASRESPFTGKYIHRQS